MIYTMPEEVYHPAKQIMYHYEAFNDKASIRVLTLFPSKSLSAEIEIKLSIVKLSDKRAYEALSYTWGTLNGDASLNSTIHCSEGQIKVTKNCEDALRRLRRENDERILWVDAICINQQDNEEKAHQVAFMGSIYRHASQAVIWLGDASKAVDKETGKPLSDLFFEYLARLSKEMKQLKDDGAEPTSSPLFRALVAQAAHYVTHKNLTPLVEGFLDAVSRPWWVRVWVVQEAALAKSATLICGGKTADYSEMYDLWWTIFTDSAHDSGLSLSLLDGYKHHMMAKLAAQRPSTVRKSSRSLLSVLDRCRRLKATDKRDHVFAIFGMFEELKYELPVPDYKKSAEGVFTDTTRFLLDHVENLEVLRRVSNVASNVDLPSWALDFSQGAQFHLPVKLKAYYAAGDSSAVHKIPDDGRELQLLGMCFDVLAEIPKASIEGYHNPYVPAKAILGYQKSIRVGRSLTTYPTGENPEEVLWRTMCWNLDGNFASPAAEETGIPFKHFSRALMSGKDIEAIEKEILLEDSCGFNDICVHSMPLCVTENGYLASVPWTAERGDRVVIFSGGLVPFVVRRDSTGDHYRFVGACYVHGIMRGEAFPKDADELEWLSIR